MCVCMYGCMYLCIYVCMYLYLLYVCMFVCNYVYNYAHCRYGGKSGICAMIACEIRDDNDISHV